MLVKGRAGATRPVAPCVCRASPTICVQRYEKKGHLTRDVPEKIVKYVEEHAIQWHITRDLDDTGRLHDSLRRQ